MTHALDCLRLAIVVLHACVVALQLCPVKRELALQTIEVAFYLNAKAELTVAVRITKGIIAFWFAQAKRKILQIYSVLSGQCIALLQLPGFVRVFDHLLIYRLRCFPTRRSATCEPVVSSVGASK